MLVTMLMGILDGVPDSDSVRVEWQVGLTTEGGVPEIGILVAIDTGRTTNDVMVVFGDK